MIVDLGGHDAAHVVARLAPALKVPSTAPAVLELGQLGGGSVRLRCPSLGGQAR